MLVGGPSHFINGARFVHSELKSSRQGIRETLGTSWLGGDNRISNEFAQVNQKQSVQTNGNECECVLGREEIERARMQGHDKSDSDERS